jgi:hypothetical protein
MEDSSSVLSPEQSLQVIRQTIEIAKRRVQDSGFHLLLWGALLVAAGLVDFYMGLQPNPSHPHIAWGIISIVGIPLSIIYEVRRTRTRVERNTINLWYGMIWLGFGISMPILIIAAVSQGISPTPFIMAMTGFAIFMSGTLLQFRPLVFGSVVIWVGALLCALSQPKWHSLIMAIAIGLGYLVPGYLLNRTKRS